MALAEMLDNLNDEMEVAGGNGNRQAIRTFDGMTKAQALAYAETLKEEHGFQLNLNAIRKGGIIAKTGERNVIVQVQSVTKPTVVFAAWSSGRAMITGEPPVEPEFAA